MAVESRELVGRDEELAVLLALLDARDGLPAVAVVTGEAGIGKTTLWLAAVEAAQARGYLVLSCRPAEVEAAFSFVGLADLIGGVVSYVLPQLPAIQRRALEAALLLGEHEIHADDRAVAAALLGALRLLAGDGPLCLAVDDVQWLDGASLAALRYALGRLDDGPVAVLLAVRGDKPTWLARAVPEERLRTVDVGGLSVGAIQEVLRSRLDATFPRPTLIRLWETSGGNPFFALELAGALQRRGGTLAPGEELPIPSDLDVLLHARLDGLSAAALEIARAVAALADPTVTLVESAVGRESDAGLAETLAARILELDGERLRFTHPLLGSAVSDRQTPSHRRSLHARLAKIVPTGEERARHLALATAEPSHEIASILEAAARAAHARGAPSTATELAEQAIRLTPATSPDEARRRLLLAADMHAGAGDIVRATKMLVRARAAAAPGNERATVLVQLAGVQTSLRAMIALYYDALQEAEDDALKASIHIHLASGIGTTEGLERTIEHAELAVRAASHVADATIRCRALAAYGATRFSAGRDIATAQMEEAISIERSLAEWPLDEGPTLQLGYQLVYSADVERGRALFHELESAAKVRNDPAAEAHALWVRALIEWRAGNWEEADCHIADSLDLFMQLGRLMPPTGFPAAVIAAHRGRIDEARARARSAIAWAEAEGHGMAKSGHGWVLGFVELSLGDGNAALAHLRRSYKIRNAFMLEPAWRLEVGDFLEALIAVGELDEADEVLETWQERAGTLDRAWALAILARSRGLLLAARGDLEGAFASFECALAEHARSTDPFHHARTLLALGRTQRRAKKRGAARATLDEALAAFERLGAPLWAEQARAELARIGGRAPSPRELTEAERRIAALVAEGRSNREVAATLYVTEHTVEGALTRAYRKLGVRSRGELAARLRRET